MRRCRREGCTREARPESPWCLTDFLSILANAYGRTVRADPPLRRVYGR